MERWRSHTSTPSVFQTLLNASVNIRVKSREGSTLLYYAAAHGDLDIVRMVLERSDFGGVGVKNNKRYALLHLAADARNMPAIQLLISAGANVNDEGDRDGKTALHLAARVGGDISPLNLSLQAEAGLSILCNSGNPPIYLAADAELDEAVELMVEAGAWDHDSRDVCARRMAPWRMEGESREKALRELGEADVDIVSGLFL
ncbi:hypothetical protein AJ80_03682 [Polytolypa hystricis UAMH7299]|uniref:Uncharacterized protein n=1 Tax=Polytolypa hystricis (strain UAMH7299) TaxID=1447883 RepID=A0A2B7Y7Q2_POLH7|nr:hypothetical protein AJ80_03682 [Polytolypa hystricis UAMH7299]